MSNKPLSILQSWIQTPSESPHAYLSSTPVWKSRVHTSEVIHRIRSGENIHVFQKKLSFDHPDQSLYHLSSAWKTFSEYGFISDEEGRCLLPSFSFPKVAEAQQYAQHLVGRPWNVQYLNNPIFPFSNVGYHNYYHVLTELLPRLLYLDYLKFPVTLPVMEKSPSFVWDFLELCSISDASLLPVDENTVLSGPSLIYAPYGMNFISESYAWLRSKLCPSPSLSSEKIVYISRADASTRTIVNEEQLFPILRDFDVDVVTLEGMSVQDQIQLFSQAKGIIGAHGAGLSNLIWQATPSLFELRPSSFPNDCFVHLHASSGGNVYQRLECDSLDEQQSMKVSVPMFAKEVQEFLKLIDRFG